MEISTSVFLPVCRRPSRETRDQIVEMFIKHMSKLTAKEKENLERLREENRVATERLIEVFADVLQTNSEAESAETAGSQIRKVLEDAGRNRVPARTVRTCFLLTFISDEKLRGRKHLRKQPTSHEAHQAFFEGLLSS
jgi:hypothetical protein